MEELIKNQPHLQPQATTQSLVISGFLGSGKTTLVRHLLAEGQAQGVRTAVISNEFGELGIDQALIGDGVATYVELAGGCVCCKLSDDLLSSLQQIWEDNRPERIVVETSGVALPYDTLINFWREPVSAWSTDEIAVVVASAEQISAKRELKGTFEDQICSADLIVLSKTDLVSSAQAEQARAMLAAMQPDVEIIAADFGRIATSLVFPPSPSPKKANPAAGLNPPAHSHEDFVAEEIEIAAGSKPEEIRNKLASLGALRVKGFVRTDQGLQLVQGVGTRVELSSPSSAVAPEMEGRLVVIRRGSTK